MKEDIFIKNNINVWSSLEDKVNIFNKKNKKKYSKDEIDELIILYNQVMNHLVFSRSNYGENDTTEYLNKLAQSAHAIIYFSPKPQIKSLLSFFFTGFPKLFRKNIKFFIVSSLIFMLPGILSFVLTIINIENTFAFFPPDTAETIRDESDNSGYEDAFLLSSYISTNNITVTFNAFAFGLTFGVGTVYVLINNGLQLGGLAGITFLRGQSTYFWSLILPHGILELFAIFVSGAAGLILGYALINPGKMSRKDALITRGKETLQLVVGCLPILLIAGITEGYFTPLRLDYIYKYIYALTTLILLLIYLAFPGRDKVKN